MIGHWLAHVFGLDDPAGGWNAFWSGIGSDLISGTPLVGVAATLLRRHNCHEPGCWRIGRFPVAGTVWTVCAKHHPAGPPTHEQIRDSAGGQP